MLFQEGAEVIQLVSEDGNSVPYHAQRGSFTGLTVSSSDGYFDADLHWGCNVTQVHHGTYNYSFCEYHTSPVIHSLAVFGRSRGGGDQGTFHCDLSTPPTALRKDTFGLLRLDRGLFFRSAFWAIPAFEIVTERERVVWDFVVQMVLWRSTNSAVLYSGESMTDMVNVEDNVISDVIGQFQALDFPSGGSIPEIVKDLLVRLHQDSLLVRVAAWLDALFGPLPQSMDSVQTSCVGKLLTYKPVNHRVNYQVSKWRTTPFQPIENLVISQKLHSKVCKDYLGIKNRIDFIAPWVQFDDTLLLIVFNNPHYETIPYLEVIYRPFFPHILYCGPGQPSVAQHPELEAYNYSFISYGKTPDGHFPGSFNYECTQRAIQMGYRVQGFLVIADDLLLVTQRIKKLRPYQMWFLTPSEVRIAEIERLRECRLGMCDFHTDWRWWEDYKPYILNLFDTFEQKQREVPLVHRCYNQLVRLNGNTRRPNGAYSDFYYIPASLAEDFAELAQIFLDHEIFLEIAVPTIVQCLAPPTDRESMTGLALWDELRTMSWTHFTKPDMVHQGFIHPTKWSYLSQGSENFVSFFCNALMFLHDPYGQINPL